jgi:hypothetical protein
MSRWWVAVAALLAACGQQAERNGSGIVSGAGPGGGAPEGDAGPTPSPGPDGGTLACVESANLVSNAGSGNICGLLKPVLGAPVEHRYREVLDDPEGNNFACDLGSSPASGTGALGHRVKSFQGPAVFMVDSTGKTIGELGPSFLTGVDFFPQDTGFAVLEDYIGATGSFPLEFIADNGEIRAPTRTSVNGAVEWPGGGLLTTQNVFIPADQRPPDCEPAGSTTFSLTRWDASGHVVAGPSTFGCFFEDRPRRLWHTNSAGWTVLLINGGPSGDDRTWRAHWLDPDLNVVSTWAPVGLPTEGFSNVTVLLDDSIAIAIGGEWRFRVPSRGTALEGPPCWLARRPNTDVKIVQNRGGYALLDNTRGGGCEDRVEVVTPDGLSCGFLHLPTSPEACEFRAAIGRDGTLSAAAYAADAGAGEPQICVLPFWPAAFGRSLW